MFIRLSPFGAINRKVAAHLLQNHEAQDGANARFDSGALRPLYGLGQVATVTGAVSVRSLYRFAGAYWFSWSTDYVRAARGPIPSDTTERTYITDPNDFPRMTYAAIATGATPYPTDSYRLGIPAPSAAPTAALNGVADNEDDLPESRAYVFTYVSALGEEGPPSPPSALLDWRPGQTVDLSDLTTGVTGDYNITLKRIYRLNTGETSSEYQFVAEIPVATSTYNDAVVSALLGEILPSTNWDQPPEGMAGIIVLPNGVLAAHYRNQVLLCEPFVPHAWPQAYRYTVSGTVVALGAFGQSLVVTTDGEPYIAHGVQPEALALEMITRPYPNLSNLGLVEMGNSVIYPSADGLVSIGVNGVGIITRNVFDEHQWKELVPSSIRGFRKDDWYIGFYDDGVTQAGFAIREDGREWDFLDDYALAGYANKSDGELYLIQNGNEVHLFDNPEADPYTLRWKSKRFRLPQPANMAVLQVDADAYPVTVKIWADGVLKYNKSIADGKVKNLPTGFQAQDWEVEISGTNTVNVVEIAESVEELQQL